MAQPKEESIPSFNGNPSRYRDYRVQVQWLVASTKANALDLVGPALIRRLTGNAFEHFRASNPADFRVPEGAQKVLNILDTHYAFLPQTEIQDAVEAFFACSRQRGQGPTEYSAIFRATTRRLEKLLTTELQREQQLKHQQALLHYERELRLHAARLEEWDQTAQLRAQQGLPPDQMPEDPEGPPSLEHVPDFVFPQAFTGYLFLRGYGLTRQQRADTIRSAGGSTRFEALEASLRASEQSYEGEYSRHGVVYFGDNNADEYYQDESWDDGYGYDDYNDYSDYYTWYAEDEHYPEEHPQQPEETLDGDPELQEDEAEALIGYLQARQKLRDTKRARGFMPTSSTETKGKAKSKGKGKGKSFSNGKGKGKPKGKPAAATSSATSSSSPSTSTFNRPPAMLAATATEPIADAFSFFASMTTTGLVAYLAKSYIAIPDGHAVLDTGCSKSLIGAEQVPHYLSVWSKAIGDKNIQPPQFVKAKPISFEGLSGQLRSTSTSIIWPAQLGNRRGSVETTIVPGNVPMLLSLNKIRNTPGAEPILHLQPGKE
eukprot:4332918-Amphidinium_carterae.1